MTRDILIDTFSELGLRLTALIEAESPLVRKAGHENPWFTTQSIAQSIECISKFYLDKNTLEEWLSAYSFEAEEIKTVGLVMAGNIPLVGFHDLLCVIMSGHKAMIKISDKDRVLMSYVIETLVDINPEIADRIQVVDVLSGFDAVIATGSDSSARYFEKYFSAYPHIIRKNRNAVGVISAEDSKESLSKLGSDIFSYFGLGCRNVSKLYLEEGVSKDLVFEVVSEWSDIINHNKYKNNYDYNYALYLLNKETFYSNDFLLLIPDSKISSRIACVHYEYFKDAFELTQKIEKERDKIQCIVSSKDIGQLDVKRFGNAQSPMLDDYADGVDTMNFLTQLR